MFDFILSAILQIILVPIISPLFIGIIRKIKAKMQNRNGASIFQPYRDLRKLFAKNEVISQDASWIFTFAPYLIFSISILVGASIPLFNTAFSANPLADFLSIVYLLGLGVFFLALAGLDTGGAFGGFGASREMMMAALAEGGIILAFLAAALVSGESNFFAIADKLSTLPLEEIIILVFAFGGFFLALLAENARFPFDNPATHLELTMIHEAMILEYSGKRLALIEWAAANQLIIFLSLAVNLFFPYGLAHYFSLALILPALIIFFFKILLLAIIIALIESSIPKVRIFKAPPLLFTSMILSLISIILIFIS